MLANPNFSLFSSQQVKGSCRTYQWEGRKEVGEETPLIKCWFIHFIANYLFISSLTEGRKWARYYFPSQILGFYNAFVRARWPHRYIKYYKWAEEQSTAAKEVRERGGKKMTRSLSRVREMHDCFRRSTKGLRKVPAQDAWDSENHSVAAWQWTRGRSSRTCGHSISHTTDCAGLFKCGLYSKCHEELWRVWGAEWPCLISQWEKSWCCAQNTLYIAGEKVKLGRPHGKSFQRLNKR